MPQPKEGVKILPGMTANVMAEPKKGAVLPLWSRPLRFSRTKSGGPHVWVVKPEDMTVHLRKVKTGDLAGRTASRLWRGSRRGETIAVSAVSLLREGMKSPEARTVKKSRPFQ